MLTSAKYYIYYNRHKSIWSVKHKGLVIYHANKLYAKDIIPVVNPAGWVKFMETEVRNVHAFLSTAVEPSIGRTLSNNDKLSRHFHRVYYVPSLSNKFTIKQNNNFNAVSSLRDVYFTADGEVYGKL